MSDKVKLIVEIPKLMYESVQNGTYCGTLYEELKNGIPLDDDSDRAEVQAYFAGQTYGWEEGRKALLDDVKAEIRELRDSWEKDCYHDEAEALNIALKIIDKHIGKAEREDKPNE